MTIPTQPGTMALTARDCEVLRLMAQGLSNHGIAERLFLSPRTVEGRIAGLYDKLRVSEAAESNRRVVAVLRYLEGE